MDREEKISTIVGGLVLLNLGGLTAYSLATWSIGTFVLGLAWSLVTWASGVGIGLLHSAIGDDLARLYRRLFPLRRPPPEQAGPFRTAARQEARKAVGDE